MADRILTISDTVALATIYDTTRVVKVARVFDDGREVYGIARSIGGDNGNFLGSDVDIRDGFLRVTTREGMEVFWRVSELMPLVATGHFMAYDW